MYVGVCEQGERETHKITVAEVSNKNVPILVYQLPGHPRRNLET
jgi:hypothetical protein